MPVYEFPDPQQMEYGQDVVAWGGDLHPDTLRLAYGQGIFPWPHRGYPLLWFCPQERAILEFDRLHIPASLAKAKRKCTFTFTIDHAFADVITHCQKAKRPGQSGTWLTRAMQKAYNQLHQEGNAHSVEVWDGDALVGGLYGVDSGGLFSGESMFHIAPNASKFALLHLINHLQQRGATFIDIQQLTPHMEALGAFGISRTDFLSRSEQERKRGLTLFPSENKGQITPIDSL
jgi:leucyl/phenylalanyl-tRNA--protein transferase